MNAKEMIVNTVKAENAKAMVKILTEENKRLEEENQELREKLLKTQVEQMAVLQNAINNINAAMEG